MKPLELASLSAITHRLAWVRRDGQRVLVASFSGEYRPGSQGNPDARFMRAVLAGAAEAWDFDAVVLDVTGDQDPRAVGEQRSRSPGGAIPGCSR